MRSRIDSTAPVVAGRLQRRGTFGGGGGGGVPRRFSRIHLPRTTGDVRSGYDVTVRMLPCPSSPRRALSCRQRHAPEVAALDVRDAVVPRQPLVQERVVGAQQVERAAVLADDAVEEQLGLAPERLAQRVVEVGKDALHRHRRRRGCAGTATGRRSCSTNASARGSASIRRTCCVEHRRRAQLTASPRASSSSSSGMLLQRKNDSRDASSRSLMRYGVPGCDARRIALDAEQELRTHQQAPERALDPVLEAAAARGLRGRTPAAARRRRRSPGGDRRGAPASRGSSGARGFVRRRPAGGRRRCGGGSATSPGAGRRRSGPAISTLRRCAPRRVSGMFTPAGYGRRNGSRVVSSSADVRLRNVTTTSR